VVWAKGDIAVDRCPTWYVTPESLVLIQEFQAWKLVGGAELFALPARMVEAFMILENELRLEMKREQQ
jgi:hypothetical protein